MGQIDLHVAEHIATITLDNPGKRNAVDAPMREGLTAAYARIELRRRRQGVLVRRLHRRLHRGERVRPGRHRAGAHPAALADLEAVHRRHHRVCGWRRLRPRARV